MTPRKLPLRVAAALLPLALAAGAAGADTLLTIQLHQPAVEIDGQVQPAQDATVEVWVGKDQISRADERSTQIVRSSEMVIVNHMAKSYTVLELPIDFAKLVPPDQQATADLYKLSGKVTPTEERKKIGDWNVRRYDIEMSNPGGMAISVVMWTTQDIDLDYPTYQKLAAQTMATAGGAELAAEMAKLEGFPVLQEITIDMGGNTVHNREELVSVEERDPPATAYSVPEGYSKTPVAARTGDSRTAAGPGPAAQPPGSGHL